MTNDDESLSEGEKQENKEIMTELNKHSDEEDEDSPEEDEGKKTESEWDDHTDIEVDTPPNCKTTTTTTTTTTYTQTITTPPIQPTLEIPTQTILEPETQAQPSPPLTQDQQINEPELLLDIAVTTNAAGNVQSPAATPTKKMRVKHTAKKRKLADVPEVVTAEEDKQLQATVAAVVLEVEKAAAAAAIKEQERAETERIAKEALEFVAAADTAQKKVIVFCYSAYCCRCRPSATATKTSDAVMEPEPKKPKVYKPRPNRGGATRKSPRPKSGTSTP